ncbi:hypothetical protein NA56DRAFT_358770 [Hyaloscypha hepaticicola]|uniref:Uncharacterized protein n=1 Tax=Hyaloscypha hepaticicola TaxID=2082293 RepID=A0A2J6PLM6_9HELO|nr:hypothetical protein NA56DRAFT_358770 [Hyaloscypha hepaticicola]
MLLLNHHSQQLLHHPPSRPIVAYWCSIILKHGPWYCAIFSCERAHIKKGQTTIQATLARGLSYIRQPRPGPVPKDSGRIIDIVLGKRLLGGDNEKLVQELFAS